MTPDPDPPQKYSPPGSPEAPLAMPRLIVGDFGRVQDDLPPAADGFLDLQRWFGFPAARGDMGGADGCQPSALGEIAGRRPVELEIGSGKGTFLIQQARLQPGTDFIGIEWAKAYWRHAADRARRHDLTNVRVLWADATAFVRQFVPDSSLRVVHLYFPDPWPKARHNKRRTMQAPFLRELHRVLQPAGEVRLATDHADYFQWMQDHAALVTAIFERLPFASPDSAGEDELVGTNFERKYRREGRTFNAMTLRKRPAPLVERDP